MKNFCLTIIFILSTLFSSIDCGARTFEDVAEEINVRVPNIELADHCKSRVYCNGHLLHTVQMSKIYNDSKTFVDLFQKYEEEVTLDNFQKLMNETNDNPSTEDIRKFVQENFSEVDELEHAQLSDWLENPSIIERIKDEHYKKWAKELNNLWPTLARRIKREVQKHTKRYSIIYVNNTFIIPGGRFKEFYYWDSYWIIKGLLITGLQETAKGMIQNFLSMVDNYGFIPNGGRVYYLMRSQPPLLTQMVQKYYEATGDLQFVWEALPRLEREFNYWHKNKTVIVKKGSDEFLMARYVVTSTGPRPESYREDYHSHSSLKGDERQKYFYEHVKAGAETGWDFSARWFSDNGTFSSNIWKMSTSDIIPVDLNSFVEKNARIMSEFFQILGKNQKAHYYGKISKQYKKAIQKILWNETDGTWYDFNIRTKKQNARFYASNLTPLYTRSYKSELSEIYARRSVDYLERTGAVKIGGIPSSLDHTGQQWDYPNAWAPLMSMTILGLYYTGYKPAKDLSNQLAHTWLQSNYDGFVLNNRAMFEKYNVLGVGSTGGGGEYEPQTGFGWTNGVIFELLHLYPEATYNERITEIHAMVPKPRFLEQDLKPGVRCNWESYR